MNKWSLGAIVVLIQAGLACAAEAVAPGGSATFFGSTLIASGIGVGVAAGGCGIGMGLVIASAIQGIARQPELTSKLQMNMLIGFALIEAQVLYALFLAIMFLFANPFAKFFS